MKAVSALYSRKSIAVRLLAWLLIIALLAPAAIPLSAKEQSRISASPAAIDGNLAAPEPIKFSGVAENYGAGGGLSFFREQWRRFAGLQPGSARSILPAFSLHSFFGSSANGASVRETTASVESSSSVTAAGAGSSHAKSVPAASSAVLPPARTAFDFDADGKADVAVWRPADLVWRVFQSSTQSVVSQPWGAPGDRIVPADYDNDGKTDFAVYTPSSGIWNIRQSSTGQTLGRQWGAAEDVPVPADFDGDGSADIAVWRPSTGIWYITKSSDSSTYGVEFGGGQFGDVPVVGDYDADGKADIAVWRAPSGNWYVQRSSSPGILASAQWGVPSDIPVPADYDADGKTDYAVWRPSSGGASTTGEWLILNSANGAMSYAQLGLSNPQDALVPADYDGDSKADFAVWRPSSGSWSIQRSSDSTFWYPQLGATGDVPAAAAFIKPSGAPTTPTARTNFALFSNGGTATASSFQIGYTPGAAINGDRKGLNGGEDAFWLDETESFNPDWLEVNFSGSKTIDEIDFFTVQDNYANPVEPDLNTTFGVYGITAFDVQYWNGSAWITIPDGSVTSNNKVWRKFVFTAVTTTKIRVIVNASLHTKSVINELEAWGGSGTATPTPSPTPTPTPAATPTPTLTVSSAELAKARLSPKNAAGGTNLYSRNFSWGSGLVGLPGRAGLDAGLSLSYNSLVWTKVGTTMVFDTDNSNVSPGFRFGFPTIEPSYTNSQTGSSAYLMVSPSGGRTELRQTAANVYESADSSYLQLKATNTGGTTAPVEQQELVLFSTSGTQMKFSWKGGAFRASEIKDANGNFITINHDENGLLQTVTDTLGRVISVNYDNESYPSSITQNWQTNNGEGSNTPHTYATFNYTTSPPINTNFVENNQNLTVNGPSNGTALKVLQSVVYADTSSTRFDYNSYGQVYKVSSHAPDSHLLNYVKTNLESPSPNQPDCPRFTETRNYIESFNTETTPTVVTINTTENQTYNVGGASGTATKIEVSMTDEPNNHVSKTYVGASGWMEGLPLATEDWANENGSYGQRRWTLTNWTQDNTSLNYLLNPRVIESKVGDATNTKRTTVDYEMQPGSSTVSHYGLVSEVKVYDTNQTTVLKRSATTYDLRQIYLDKRIIGLPAISNLYDGIGNLLSKVTYGYDNDDGFMGAEQNIAPVQHDNTNYGVGFVVGRGNLTSLTRHDVTGETSAATSQIKYNTAGAAVASIDPLNRQSSVSYADKFIDGSNGNNSRNTFAYPTKMTDPAGNFSEVKYRYDIGANVWAKSPAPQNQAQGKTTERIFDALGRLQKQAIIGNGGAYTRYEYPASGVQSKVYSTVTDMNNNGSADAADEVLAESYFDGADRVLQSRTELPNGNWSGQKTEYYTTGQVMRQSVPAEVTSSWALAGDDAVRGSWLWTSQQYDWKGRVTRTVNTDGTDKLTSYDGCGCAGGQITTLQGELVPRGDQPNINGRRTQKIYADILGRNYKTESLNWDGSVYSTTRTTFNGRDQATLVRQYAGADTSSTFPDTPPVGSIYQDTTAIYDGHGRVRKTHNPEQQNSDGTPGYTTTNYNADDSVQSVVDARGASTNYAYNDARGLLTNISYTGSNITAAPGVSFVYDNTGNRTQMTDGLGTVEYTYTQLSQLKTEKRTFNETLADAPAGNNAYLIVYDYALSGQLKSLKDPFGYQSDYSLDKIGRLSAINGSGYGDLPASQPVASDLQYRAFGSLKKATYGNGLRAEMQYNNRLQSSSFALKNNANQTLMGKSYLYTTSDTSNDNDGNIKRTINIDDTNPSSSKLNRAYSFDNVGRIASVRAGNVITAPGPANGRTDGPFEQNYSYDAFDNLTNRSERVWTSNAYCTNCPDWRNYTETPVNNRNTKTGWEYDNDGNLTRTQIGTEVMTFSYDAAGSQRLITQSNKTTSFDFDGDGQKLRWVENGAVKNYYINSTLLGATLVELTAGGAMQRGYIYTPSGARIAKKENNQVLWLHEEPAHESSRETKMGSGGAINEPSALCLKDSNNCSETLTAESGQVASRVETDPLGGETSDSPAYNYSGTSSYNTNPTGFYGGLESGASRIRSLVQSRFNSWLRSMQFWAFSNPVTQTVTQRRQTGYSYEGSSVTIDGRTSGGGIWTPRYQTVTSTVVVGYNLSILSLSSFATVGGNSGGGGDDLPCPTKQTPKNGSSISSTQAFGHYVNGSGSALNMNATEVNASVPSLGSFPEIQKHINNGTNKPFEQISIVRRESSAVPTSGDQTAFLGRIVFNATGVLNLYPTGDFQFYGTIGVNTDIYNFDKDRAKGKQRRTSMGELSTGIGSAIHGKAFNININGRFSVNVEGNQKEISSANCR